MIMPAISQSFKKRLKKYDRYLDVVCENDGHFVIIDKSKVRGVRAVNLGGAKRYDKIYDKVYHLKPNEALGGHVINELQFRSKERWSSEKAIARRINEQGERADEMQRKEQEYIVNEAVKGARDVGRVRVVIDGWKR